MSLPLFGCLFSFGDRPIWESSQEAAKTLKQLHLEDDIEVSIVLAPKTHLEFSASSARGEEVLKELKERAHYVPCPEGDCEFDGVGECKWCGGSK